MAINVEVKQEKVEAVDEYPKLMISVTGTIVQFEKPGVGQVVGFLYPDFSSADAQGDVANDWSMVHFKDFHGTVTLSNK